MITRLTRDSLEYYLTSQSEVHRDGWTNVLILILTKLLKLNEEKVRFKDFYILYNFFFSIV
jgi:hypothetical protein